MNGVRSRQGVGSSARPVGNTTWCLPTILTSAVLGASPWPSVSGTWAGLWSGPGSWVRFRLPCLPPRLSLAPRLPSHWPFLSYLWSPRSRLGGRQSLLQSPRLIPQTLVWPPAGPAQGVEGRCAEGQGDARCPWNPVLQGGRPGPICGLSTNSLPGHPGGSCLSCGLLDIPCVPSVTKPIVPAAGTPLSTDQISQGCCREEGGRQ